MAAPVLLTVHFVGGPLDGRAQDYDQLPASSCRAEVEDCKDDVEYLLYLFEVNDRPAWGFVAGGLSMEEAQSRLARHLRKSSEGEPA